MRTLCREIKNYKGKEVELFGWVKTRRDHGKLIFIDLNDYSGISQIIFSPSEKNLYALAQKLRPYWVIHLKGEVLERPKGMENPKIESGQYEIKPSFLEILSPAKNPPFDLTNAGLEINEELRMEYRYLDLRRPRLQKNLKTRALVTKFIRDFLTEKEFIEVETPILSKSTPEGARDYLVPSRLEPGKFYALPQSPQQYKQLLMVAGLEKYFQIAKCFRDEDSRGDRQPEFTQLDLEMSFVSQEEILNLIEELLINLVAKLFKTKKISQKPFPRLSYQKSMEKYHSDRPDLRSNKNDSDELAFAFITDFPMFEWKETEKRWDAVHHPFTRPQIKDKNDLLQRFKKDPSTILAHQYDVVCNGYEIGGGSLRIYQKELLETIFKLMGHSSKNIKEKFGHLLKAFEYGVPPHGGIAIGLDRLLAILLNEPNIREVIAFPKSGDGRDLLMKAPSVVEASQLKELSLKIFPSKIKDKNKK